MREGEFTETKYIFLDIGGRRWANGEWRELEVLLKVLRARCDLCGRRLTAEDVGYVRVNGVVEPAGSASGTTWSGAARCSGR